MIPYLQFVPGCRGPIPPFVWLEGVKRVSLEDILAININLIGGDGLEALSGAGPGFKTIEVVKK